jgi:23S rRNA (cytosine1962-C5)-methyltransferase
MRLQDYPELTRRLTAARARRAPLLTDRTDSVRMVHGQADALPDITIDSFAGECLVISLYASLTEPEENLLADACVEVFKPRAIYLKRRPKEARVVANTAQDVVSPPAPIRGEPWEGIATENGLKYRIRPGAGLSVGLFLDMRDTRAWVREHIHGRSVLNCFAYTCAFGVAAKQGAAGRVANVDVSRKVLDWGVENYELNGLDTERRDFIAGDVFEWLAHFRKKRELFEAVILDPPSFSNTKSSRFSAAKDYPSLVTAAVQVLAPSGLLVACCNLAQLTQKGFGKLVRQGISEAGRGHVSADWLGASPVDFPPHPDNPHGLNVLLVKMSPPLKQKSTRLSF